MKRGKEGIRMGREGVGKMREVLSGLEENGREERRGTMVVGKAREGEGKRVEKERGKEMRMWEVLWKEVERVKSEKTKT